MPKQGSKDRQLTSLVGRLKSVPLLVAVGLITASVGMSFPVAHADDISQLQAQVDNLNAQNAENHQQVTSLEAQASSYQQEINRLDSQIASLQAQIDTNLAKEVQIQANIQEKQQEVNQQKAVLGEDLKAMYVNGQMSTIEELATSKSLSSFVNAETYRSAVQNKIQETLDQIAKLENQLKGQEAVVAQLVSTLSQQQGDLAAKQNQQSQLLAMNQSQQNQYNAQIQANQSKISSLEEQIIEANLPSGSNIYYGSACDTSHGDTYPRPLCNSAQDSLIDNWGLYNRECVSYVAWKEFSTGHQVPYGLGNAGDWPSHVPKSWIDKDPQPGDAAVRPAIPGYGFDEGGTWVADVGHVMYIEHVNGDGTIAVSQYNASLNGEYSYVPSRSATGLVFIHFPAQ